MPHTPVMRASCISGSTSCMDWASKVHGNPKNPMDFRYSYAVHIMARASACFLYDILCVIMRSAKNTSAYSHAYPTLTLVIVHVE